MENICPFGSPLVTETCECEHADQVVRRGGAEIICQDAAAYSRCRDLFQKLKQVALPEFEVEDDLTTMPHSVLQKIQFGGLTGLQTLLTEQTEDKITNVAKYGNLDSLPYAELVHFITEYKLKRRHDRG